MSVIKRTTKAGKLRYAVVWRENGRQREKWFDRAGPAKAYDAEVTGRAAAGGSTPSPRARLCDLIDQWWEDRAVPHLSMATLNLYQVQRRARIEHPDHGIERTKLSELTTQLIDQWVAQLARAGHRPRAINSTLTTLSAICQAGVDWDVMPRNPVSRVRRLPEERRSTRSYTPEEVATIAEAMALERDRALVLTAAFTGMRQGELFALTWSDITANTVEVRRALDPKRESKTTKTGKQRQAPLFATTREVLDRWREVAPLGVTDLVFPTTDATPILKSNWNRRNWRPACREAAHPDEPWKADAAWECPDPTCVCTARFHDLRHSFATLVIGQGATAKLVMDWMGHSSIRTTFDRYGHLFERDTREVVLKVDARIAKAAGMVPSDPARTQQMPALTRSQ